MLWRPPLWGLDGVVLTPRLFNLSVPFVVFLSASGSLRPDAAIPVRHLPRRSAADVGRLGHPDLGRSLRRSPRDLRHSQSSFPRRFQSTQCGGPASEAPTGFCHRARRCPAGRENHQQILYSGPPLAICGAYLLTFGLRPARAWRRFLHYPRRRCGQRWRPQRLAPPPSLASGCWRVWIFAKPLSHAMD